jgi:hypothetical protein
MAKSDVVERDRRLDLFRAICLWLLFLEELPAENASFMNVRAYGFSDATAIFILVFGYTAGFVYGEAMRQRGVLLASAEIVRRAWQVYVAHVFLFVFYVAEISYVARSFQNPTYAMVTNISDLLGQPAMTLVEGLALNLQPSGMEELALYIVLIVAFPPMLWLLLRSPIIALAASATLYALARERGWNFAAFPSGTWPLNPLAWQLLFVFGGWLGIYGGRGFERVLGSRTVLVLAIAYLALALVMALESRVPTLAPPQWLKAAIYPIDRTNIDLTVMAHVLAIAFVAVRLVPANWSLLSSRTLRPVLLCGEYSLATFCFGVFLAFAGYSVFVQVLDTTLMHVAIGLGGIVMMVGLAGFLAWFETAPGRPRPSVPHPTDPAREAGQSAGPTASQRPSGRYRVAVPDRGFKPEEVSTCGGSQTEH